MNPLCGRLCLIPRGKSGWEKGDLLDSEVKEMKIAFTDNYEK